MARQRTREEEEKDKNGGGLLLFGLFGLGAAASALLWGRRRASAGGGNGGFNPNAGMGPGCGGANPLELIGLPCPEGSPGTTWAATRNPEIIDALDCHTYNGLIVSQTQGSLIQVFWRVQNVGPNPGMIEVSQRADSGGQTIRQKDPNSLVEVLPGEWAIIEAQFTPQSFLWFSDLVSVGFELDGTNCQGAHERELSGVRSGKLDYASEHPELFAAARQRASISTRSGKRLVRRITSRRVN